MALPPGANQLTIVWFNDATAESLTTHIALDFNVGASDTAIFDDVVEWWDTGYTTPTVAAQKTHHENVIRLTKIELVDLNDPSAAPRIRAVSPTIAGTQTGGSYPSQTTPVASLSTANRGRSYRGRCYLPVVAANQGDTDGILTTANAQAMADGFARLLASLYADTAIPQVWSRTLDEMNEVTLVRVGRELDTQRRRRRSFGETYLSGVGYP